jgi:hypothetical protein
MMSYTVSVAWSRPVLSLCCIEYGLSHNAVLSGHITTVAMSRSGQLGRRYTVGTHCSGMHVSRCCFGNARACVENTRA